MVIEVSMSKDCRNTRYDFSDAPEDVLNNAEEMMGQIQFVSEPCAYATAWALISIARSLETLTTLAKKVDER